MAPTTGNIYTRLSNNQNKKIITYIKTFLSFSDKRVSGPVEQALNKTQICVIYGFCFCHSKTIRDFRNKKINNDSTEIIIFLPDGRI